MQPSPKLGILAGGGDLPSRIVQSCRETGREFFLVAFEGQTNPDIVTDHVEHAWVRLGAAGTTLKHLRAAGVKELVMAGPIKRPSLKDLRPDLWATKFFAASGAASLGDDGLLSALVKALEAEGFAVVGVDDLLPDILAPAGVYSDISPSETEWSDIEAARDAALALGAEDKGQGVIAFQGEILAREDEDGTDSMLQRVSDLPGRAQGGVLVKVCKPGQETRADLPTIGVHTVEAAFRAGLQGVAVQAGKALVVDIDGVKAAADRHGLFVVGIEASSPLIYLIAGEASGDVLGARVMDQLKDKNSAVRFAGIGGPKMAEQGLASLFPMDELALMGLTEILPHIPKLLKRINQTVQDIQERKPDLLLTIDAPGFCFRVARKISGKGIKRVHYVAPSVWAWKPGRAKRVAQFLDHLLTLLPFEPPYFEREGLPATFVGHSVVEGGADNGDGEGFRKRHGFSKEDVLLVLLPGSRRGEVDRLMGVFCQTALNIAKTHPRLKIVIPTLESRSRQIRKILETLSIDALVLEGDAEKYDAFAAADVALAASGTVALELAMAGTPSIIGYRVNALTAWLVRRLIKTPYVNLVNVVLKREAVPEFLQERCRADLLSTALIELLDDENRALAQTKAAAEALKELGKGGPSPSGRAADALLTLLQENRHEHGHK